MRRKTNRESSEIPSGLPPARTNELVERMVQDWSIGGARKWLLSVHAQANHRLRPSRWVSLNATGVAPQDRATLVSKLTRKSAPNFHETIADELADLRVIQHGTQNLRSRDFAHCFGNLFHFGRDYRPISRQGPD